jgi:hypothetical protein
MFKLKTQDIPVLIEFQPDSIVESGMPGDRLFLFGFGFFAADRLAFLYKNIVKNTAPGNGYIPATVYSRYSAINRNGRTPLPGMGRRRETLPLATACATAGTVPLPEMAGCLCLVWDGGGKLRAGIRRPTEKARPGPA